MASYGSTWLNVAAASGSYDSGVRILAEWSTVSQSVANNSSVIRITLKIVTGQWGAMYGSATQWANVNCAGWNQSSSYTIQQGSNQTRQIFAGEWTIGHNTDGSGSFWADFNASFNMSFNGWVGTVYGSISGTLDTIPRASTPSVSGTLEMGSEITIKTNRAASIFTHTLKYNFQNHQAVIAENVTDSTTWTPDLETFAPWLTNAGEADCKIICNTYNGSQLIGTKEITFKLRVPPSVMPTMSSVFIGDAEGLFGLYGNAYVQNKSSVYVTISAAGVYGSTIAKYEATMDGVTATGNPVALGTPSQTGSRTITVKVTDTRGRSVSATRTITVAEYFAPSISAASAYRYNTMTEDEDDESTTVLASLTASACNVNLAGANTLKTEIYSRLKNADEWTPAEEWVESTVGQSMTYTATHSDQIAGCSEANRYEFRFVASDGLGGSTELILEVGTAQPVMDLKADGEGMGLFSIADKQGVKIGKPVFLTKESKIATESDAGEWLDAMTLQENGRLLFPNHPTLANASYLLGQLASGNATRLLGINENDQVELNWTQGAMRGRVWKTLWEGNCAVGSKITVPELPYYNFILVHVEDPTCLSPVPCVRRDFQMDSGINSTFYGCMVDDYNTERDPWVFVTRLETYNGVGTSLTNASTFIANIKVGNTFNHSISKIVGIF